MGSHIFKQKIYNDSNYITNDINTDDNLNENKNLIIIDKI